MTTDKKKAFIINVFYMALVTALCFLAVKYLAVWIMPFLLGFAIAFLLKPVVRVLQKATHAKRSYCAVFAVLLAYALLGLLLWFAGSQLVIQTAQFFKTFPELYAQTVEPVLSQASLSIGSLFDRFSPDTATGIQNILSSSLDAVQNAVSQLSAGAVGWVTDFAAKVPGFLLGFCFMIISSIFISMDYHKILSFLLRQLNDRHRALAFDIKDYLVHSVFKLVKAYVILMVITFLELAIGLTVLRVEYAIVIAGIIALLDILPVIGTGGIVIPWILIEAVRGNIRFAVSLTILYGIITVIRNFIEPKIVGQSIGLHPLVTLFAMYFGLQVLGVLGMLLAPLTVIILKNLNDSGKIRLWRN